MSHFLFLRESCNFWSPKHTHVQDQQTIKGIDMRSNIKISLSLITLILTVAFSALALDPINTFGVGGGIFSDPPRTEVAIKGYDTVAYFKLNKPTPGSDAFVTTWKGAKWKFSSAENLQLFVASPEKYAPQYGGYCAYGVSKGYAVKIEPDQFAIVDGKLYLNYDADVSKKWNADRAGFIKKADSEFTQLFKK